MTFEGFPEAALDFYDDLELDNTKSFWQAHKAVYDEAVAAPMKALTAALEPEFGAAKIFRPYRDVRFAKDKSPYKTHQGAYVATGPSTGYYVQIGAAGVMVGVGYYEASSARLAVIREAISDDAHGAQLAGDPRRAGGRGLDGRRRDAQDCAARLRRRAPADRPSAAQVTDGRPRVRVRPRHPFG